MTTAKITDIIVHDNTECQLFRDIPVKYLHSESLLKQNTFKFAGEVKLEDLTGDEVVVVIDSFAFRQRHQETTRIIRIRTGGYTGTDKKFRLLKLVAVIKDSMLFLVTEKSNDRMNDIAPRMPIRRTGVFAAKKAVSRASAAA